MRAIVLGILDLDDGSTAVGIKFELKSDNSNFTLAVHSPKLNHAETHFLSHFGGKKGKNRPGFEPVSVDQKLIVLPLLHRSFVI